MFTCDQISLSTDYSYSWTENNTVCIMAEIVNKLIQSVHGLQI